MKRVLFSILVYLCFACLIPRSVYSEDEAAVYEPTAGNFFIVGARALGMGGAHLALASDATALVYNPAGLARVTRIEFSGGLTHQRWDSQTGWALSGKFDGPAQNNTRFSSAGVVLPVPTYRGSLVLALGVNRIKSFDSSRQFFNITSDQEESEIELESGGIHLWSLGAAVDISPNISVGGAINWWSGKGDYTWLYERIEFLPPGYSIKHDDRIVDRYGGFNAKLGVRIQPNKFLVLAGTIDSPVTLTIEEDFDSLTVLDGQTYAGGWSSEYKVSLPFSLGAGAALSLNNFTLAGDVHYTDWTQMEYKRVEDIAESNRQIKRTYTDAFRFHLGAEYLIPQISTSLRAGFYRDPLPYKSLYVKKNRTFFTAGVGFLIDQVMTLDVAWAHGSWELRDFIAEGLTEKYTADRIFVSVAYRL
jgi:long-subunit fatty acid transport protein